jgi:hypothetical protein
VALLIVCAVASAFEALTPQQFISTPWFLYQCLNDGWGDKHRLWVCIVAVPLAATVCAYMCLWHGCVYLFVISHCLVLCQRVYGSDSDSLCMRVCHVAVAFSVIASVCVRARLSMCMPVKICMRQTQWHSVCASASCCSVCMCMRNLAVCETAAVLWK